MPKWECCLQNPKRPTRLCTSFLVMPGERCNMFSLYWSRCSSMYQTMGLLKFLCCRALNLFSHYLDCMSFIHINTWLPVYFPRTVPLSRRHPGSMLRNILRVDLLKLFPKPGNVSISYCLEGSKWFHKEKVYLDNKSTHSLWKVCHNHSRALP